LSKALDIHAFWISKQNTPVFFQLCFVFQSNQWRYVRTRVRNLLKMGTHPNVAISMSFSRKGPWKCARTLATQTGMTNQWLKDQGASLKLRPLKRSAICQRTVGEYSLPSYGPVI
jgi:hypothetical protein